MAILITNISVAVGQATMHPIIMNRLDTLNL